MKLGDFVKAQETVTLLITNKNGSFTYYNEKQIGADGKPKDGEVGVMIDPKEVSVALNSTTKKYEFKNSTGNVIGEIDANAGAIAFNNADNGFTSTNVQAALEELKKSINTVGSTKGDLTLAGGLEFAFGDGVAKLLANAGIQIANGGVTTDKLADKAVVSEKLTAGVGADGRVGVAGADGTVVYKTLDEVVKANTTNELKLQGSSLTSTVNGKSSTVILSEENLTSTKGVTSTSITVGNGGGSTLKDVTLEIKPGENGQVMVTKGDKSTWVNQSEIVPTTKNELELSTDNKLVSTVNDVASLAVDFSKYLDNTDHQQLKDFKIEGPNLSISIDNGTAVTVPLVAIAAAVDTDKQQISSFELLTGNKLKIVLERGGEKEVDLSALQVTYLENGTNTTVSGDGTAASKYKVNVSDAAIHAAQKTSEVINGVNTTVTTTTDGNNTKYAVNVSNDAIQAGQKTSTVTNGSTKVSVSTAGPGTTGNSTEYTVDVVESALSLQNIGGKVTNNQITTGNNGQVLITKDGTTEWVDQSTLVPTTTHTLGVSGNTLTSTMNGVAPTTTLIHGFSNILNGTTLTTSANGLTAPVDLAPVIKAGETLTALTQDGGGIITYKPERGANQTANVVSAADDNLITYNVGAFLDVAKLQANQKTTTVVNGTNTTVTPAAPNATGNTEYKVNVNAATGAVIGAVKPGAGLAVAADGTLSVNTSGTGLGKALTGDNIIDVANGSNAVLVPTQLKINNGSITSEKIQDATIQGVDLNVEIAGAGLVKNSTTNNLDVQAQNGVKVDNDFVKLGGNLTEATTITNNGNNLTIATNTTEATGKLVISGLDKAKVQATDATNGVTQHLLAVGSDNVVKALKAAMPKFFYMPSIIIPISSQQLDADGAGKVTGDAFANGAGTINLHGRYAAQFGGTTLIKSSAAAPTLPVLPANELHYYITWFDETVFEKNSVKVNENGVLTYKVKSGVDITVGSFMNIVFAVREN